MLTFVILMRMVDKVGMKVKVTPPINQCESLLSVRSVQRRALRPHYKSPNPNPNPNPPAHTHTQTAPYSLSWVEYSESDTDSEWWLQQQIVAESIAEKTVSIPT